VGKTWAKITRCQAKCDLAAYSNGVPPTDCEFPWGGSTNGCVQGTKGKGGALIEKRCAGHCPACYDSGGSCNANTGFDVWAGNDINGHRPLDAVEIFVSLDWTNDLGCTDQNAFEVAEVKCRASINILGGKLFASYSKCLSKCRAIQAKGALPL